MGPKSKESRRHIQAVLAALDVLDCFAGEPFLGLAELNHRTGLQRSRIMRILGTLESRGYLLEDPGSGGYTPGPRLMVLGKVFERHQDLPAQARPILRKLADDTGESSSLFVQDGRERMVLVREEGTQVLRMAITEGQRMPLHAGASSKVLLAFGAREDRARLAREKQLPPLTPDTITDPRRLGAELNRIRRQGYALSRGERVAGTASIAAPVFDDRNRFLGALGIGGPEHHYRQAEAVELRTRVIAAAQELSHRLGWRAKKTLRGATNGK